MRITIDESSGFCWGVVRTIEIVEEILQKENNVFVLGNIIHNPREIERLEKKGLKTISHEDLSKIAAQKPKVIIRAHGEPPSTYLLAKKLGIELIDATCPLVTALQKRVKKFYKQGYQIVILGKKEHAEIIGIRGVCNDECIVVRSVEEAIEKVDLKRKTVLFSQTTMDKATFYKIKDVLEKHSIELINGSEIDKHFIAKDTICKYVADREDTLRKFASENDIIIFVAGRDSSNGRSLFKVCNSVNQNTYFIEDICEIDYSWLDNVENIGITGATSTPQWYLEKVKIELEMKNKN